MCWDLYVVMQSSKHNANLSSNNQHGLEFVKAYAMYAFLSTLLTPIRLVDQENATISLLPQLVELPFYMPLVLVLLYVIEYITMFSVTIMQLTALGIAVPHLHRSVYIL